MEISIWECGRLISFFYFKDKAVYNIIKQLHENFQVCIKNGGIIPMKVALAQMNPTVGDLRGNVLKIKEMAAKARDGGADLVIFPEMAVTGYPPHDLFLYRTFIAKVEEIIRDEILPQTEGIDLLLGTPWREPREDCLFNSALLLRDGRIASVHHQTVFAGNSILAENRYITRADSPRLADVGGRKAAITIGGDIGAGRDDPITGHPSRNPVAELFKQGAELLINIASSPYILGAAGRRAELLSALARQYRTGAVWVNQVGGNDELIFDGGSMVCSAEGKIVFRAPPFREGVFFFDGEAMAAASEPLALPEGIDWVFSALKLGLGDYLAKSGFDQVVLGLSGGIDSAVVAALAAETLGPEKVLGVMMPSRYSSEHSIEDSEILGRNLGIGTRLIPIERPFCSLLDLFSGDALLMDLAEENLQARIRGIILMFISNRERRLVLPTGNKSELSVGYSTLYGDMCGGLSVLADLSKNMVYRLAEYINQRGGREIIPRSIIGKAPSAELRPGQKDQDSLPPYEILDELVRLYMEENRSPDEIISAGFDPATVREVIGKITGSEYKRFQSPPRLRVTTPGFCRRMSLAGKDPWL